MIVLVPIILLYMMFQMKEPIRALRNLYNAKIKIL
jgi:hypothetical protein